MRWTGPKKPIYVKLPVDLHQAVKGAAPGRTRTVEQAYIDGMTTWLDTPQTGVADTIPKKDTTPVNNNVLDSTGITHDTVTALQSSLRGAKARFDEFERRLGEVVSRLEDAAGTLSQVGTLIHEHSSESSSTGVPITAEVADRARRVWEEWQRQQAEEDRLRRKFASERSENETAG